jgi:hypothetical protein
MARLALTSLLWTGQGICGFSLWMATLGLLEGVTLLAGEGQRLLAESPEQIQRRLTVIGCMITVGTAGWLLARLCASYRQPSRLPWRERLAKLTVELLLFLAGCCLAFCLLIVVAGGRAEYPVPRLYYAIAASAGLGAPVLIALAWVVHRQ